jgi:type II secretory pathway pseudopilin PulG
MLELLIVMVIIGIIIAFILVAAFDGLRRAEERATHALISKIDAALNDRLDALTTTKADFNAAHAYIAAMWPQNGVTSRIDPSSTIPFVYDANSPQLPTGPIGNGNPVISTPSGVPRAAVIAQFDRVKAELPDVFSIQNDPNYPFNFAAMPYSGGANGIPNPNLPATATPYCTYMLPIGVGIVNDQVNFSYGGNPSPVPIIYNPASPPSNLPTYPNHTGIFGASYTALAGLNLQLARQLGKTLGSPANVSNWYDGADNDAPNSPGYGLIDDVGESGFQASAVANLLANHTHKTARSEVLYAVLVYSTGPLGSTFSPDDFDDSQVKDTDGDGLMEFVDAWGEPLQFYRWPIFYYGVDPNRTDVQRGYLPYGFQLNLTAPPSIGATLPRDQTPLDPNQQLLAPAWWSSTFNSVGPFTTYQASGSPLSGGASLFQQFFHTLVDPNTNGATTASGTNWDRGATYLQRRAYYSKPLILSSGPDKVAGVPRLDSQYFQALAGYAGQKFSDGYLVGNNGLTGFNGTATKDTPLLQLENQAAQVTLNRSADAFQTPACYYTYNTSTQTFTLIPNSGPDFEITTSIQDAGADDITNHNLVSPGGVIQ